MSLLDARVVLEQVADHQDPAGALGGRDDLLGLGDRLRQRLLDEAVLAGLEHAHGEVGVGRHRRGDDDRVELGVGQQLVEVAARRARRGTAAPTRSRASSDAVADPAQLGAGQAVEVAGEVRAPVAEADDPDPDRSASQADQVARALMPRVTPRKSTTSGARADHLVASSSGWRGDDHRAVARLERRVERLASAGRARAARARTASW